MSKKYTTTPIPTILYLACSIKVLEDNNYIFEKGNTARKAFKLSRLYPSSDIQDKHLLLSQDILNFFRSLKINNKVNKFVRKTITELNKNYVSDLSGLVAYAPILYKELSKKKNKFTHIKVHKFSTEEIKTQITAPILLPNNKCKNTYNKQKHNKEVSSNSSYLKDKNLPNVTIYTDGGYKPYLDFGAFCAILLFEDGTKRTIARNEAITSAVDMELKAVLYGLQSLGKPHNVILYCDCLSVIDDAKLAKDNYTIEDLQAAIKTVGKLNLLNRLSKLLHYHNVNVKWVKGHDGDKYNTECDKVCTLLMETTESKSVDITE